jgi:hypothetical protein
MRVQTDYVALTERYGASDRGSPLESRLLLGLLLCNAKLSLVATHRYALACMQILHKIYAVHCARIVHYICTGSNGV